MKNLIDWNESVALVVGFNYGRTFFYSKFTYFDENTEIWDSIRKKKKQL